MANIPAMTSEAERDFLAHCVRLAPHGYVVELGPWQGATTATMARVANERGLQMVTIDRFTADFGLNDNKASNAGLLVDNLLAAGIEPLPRIVVGDSSDVPDGVDHVGFLFIDTEHDAATVTRELEAWLPLTVPGAVVAFHDYGWHQRYPDYTPAIDRALLRAGPWELVGQAGYLAAFKGTM